MSDNSSKWLTGCGVGCVAVIVVIVIIGTGGYMYVKSRLQPLEDAKTAVNQLEEKLGRVEDYMPDSDGAIKPERVRAFLAARDETAQIRKHLGESIVRLSDEMQRTDKREKSFSNVLRFLGQGFGVLPELGEFYGTRSRALLAAGMSAGEYSYIYVAAFYGMLGKSPSDGPEFRLEGAGRERIVVEEDDREIRGSRRRRAAWWIHDFHLSMFRRQLKDFESKDLNNSQDSWRKVLEAEVTALSSDDERLPWQDGLPEILHSSLRPFKDQLAASYNAQVNPLELAQWRSSQEVHLRYR